ncbi:MAG: cysteine hydrolase family protein [Gammaproteobacteria bacterium]
MSANYVDEFTESFTLNPSTTALLVIDMQNATGNPKTGLGKLLEQQGRLDSAKYRFDRIANTIVPNTRRLLAHFRAIGAPVIFVTYGAELPDCSDVPKHIRKLVIATNNKAGEIEHEIVDELKPQAGEPVLNKVTMGAFGSTGIDTLLKAKGITEVVCTGVSTNNCVGMTAMEASDRGYSVVLTSDATGTCSDEMQDAFIAMFLRLWGKVLTTDEVISEIGDTEGSLASAG